MKSLARYRQIFGHRHEYAQQWKARTGGKVIGYFCTYVPEEIIYASGMLPVRVLGSHEPQDLTDRHIFPTIWCAYCRDCLAQGLKGRYSYLDGVVNAWSCQHIRQTYYSWRTHVPVEFEHDLYVPTSIHRPSARACLVAETEEFARVLEAWMGKSISDAALDRAIQVYNEDRRLMKEIYELRKGDNPPISGAQAMDVVLASAVMDKEEHIRLLRETLGELSTMEPKAEGDRLPRLLLLGGENDDRDLVEFIESLGARVVTDEHCTGRRYFWEEVSPNQNRLVAIANRYADRVPCSQKDVTSPPSARRRLSHIRQLAEDYHVHGAVIVQQKFCDPYRQEIPYVESMLREKQIPSLILEVELTLPTGQFRTRIEAFLETLHQETV